MIVYKFKISEVENTTVSFKSILNLLDSNKINNLLVTIISLLKLFIFSSDFSFIFITLSCSVTFFVNMAIFCSSSCNPVSYTHLDVYKRQAVYVPLSFNARI